MGVKCKENFASYHVKKTLGLRRHNEASISVDQEKGKEATGIELCVCYES